MEHGESSTAPHTDPQPQQQTQPQTQPQTQQQPQPTNSANSPTRSSSIPEPRPINIFTAPPQSQTLNPPAPAVPPKAVRPLSATSVDKSPVDEKTPWRDTGAGMSLPPLRRGSTLDWIVPVNNPPLVRGRFEETGLDTLNSPSAQNSNVGPKERSVEERLKPTMLYAKEEEAKYFAKARLTGWALNGAIGLQVVISALITGLAAVTTGKRTQIMTSILGGAGTVVASYLARARGSNEPELSISRVKDLQKFSRDCDSFVMDHGAEVGHEHDERIESFRREFEELLGNGSGERKMSTPV